MSELTFKFGQYTCPYVEIIYTTTYSYVIINTKPLSIYHVLVIPKRVVRYVSELTYEELVDLMATSSYISTIIKLLANTDSITFAIQDGSLAGQTVHHVHMHVIPRFHSDFEKNEIYGKLSVGGHIDAATSYELLRKHID